MKIAVAGGTGTVGRHVVDTSTDRGHDTVVLSRAAGIDLVDGTGLDAALDGVDAVIDVASVRTRSAKASVEFFRAVLTFGRIHLVPVMRSQPVAALEVAQRLVEHAETGPAGRTRELSGPDVLHMVDMVRAYTRAAVRSSAPLGVTDRSAAASAGKTLRVPLAGRGGRGVATGPGAGSGAESAGPEPRPDPLPVPDVAADCRGTGGRSPCRSPVPRAGPVGQGWSPIAATRAVSRISM